MNISSREEGGVTVVGVEGHLDTNTAPDAQRHFEGLQDAGVQKILLDFGDLDYITSAGLRVLFVTAKRFGASGGSLRICGLSELVKEVFEISGSEEILDVFGTTAEALEGF